MVSGDDLDGCECPIDCSAEPAALVVLLTEFLAFLMAAVEAVELFLLLDCASFCTEVDLGGIAGEAPRDDLRLPKLPRLGLGEGESVTFFDLTNSLLVSLLALGEAE